MKELTDILAACKQARAAGVAAALATVVRVEGSAYRQPGARMLIAEDGSITGGVSGGCLERDVVRRAGGVMASTLPTLVRYDTAPDPDGGPGYSLGCGGSIEVLIEVVSDEMIEMLAKFHEERAGIFATVISRGKSLGHHLTIDEDSRLRAGFGGGPATRIIRAENAGDRAASEPAVEIFLELIQPPLELLIFGAGNDSVPLAAFAKNLGWRITVVDLQSGATNLGPRAEADHTIRCRVEDLDRHIAITRPTAAVVMTHHFKHDLRILDFLATASFGAGALSEKSPLIYIGLLGPRHRSRLLLQQLDRDIPLLHAPVGLDIGAHTPQEVALAIVAEITAKLRGRAGGSLCEHGGSIHPVVQLQEAEICQLTAF